MTEPTIFFHVGLGKVASTFLQKKVFPHLQGIHYVPPRCYRKSKRIIANQSAARYLVSREFDRQLEQEVRWFTATYPHASIIVFFRRQDQWMASQYRRYVKNGGLLAFDAFIDLDRDLGEWKIKDLYYQPMLQVIRECSDQDPLVILYDQLLESPQDVIAGMCRYMRVSEMVPKSFARVHTSYTDKQLKFLQTFCRKFLKSKPRGYSNKLIHWIRYRPFWLLFHLILWVSVFFPDRWVSEDPLIPPDSLERIRKYFEADWRQIQAWANVKK